MVPDVDELSSSDPLKLTRVQIPELPQEVLLAFGRFAGTAGLSHAAARQGLRFESRDGRTTNGTPRWVR